MDKSTSLQLIKDPHTNEALKNRCLHNAEDAVTKSASMLRKLMDFSRVQKLNPVVLNINSTLTNFESILKLSLGSKNELILNLNSSKLCKLDANQLETVLINLLINSKDAMPLGGKVEISTFDISISENSKIPDGDFILLKVSDNGDGISPAILHKVFEPFFTTKELGQGTGLGLSMVATFVQQTGGYIEIDSELGKGTTFSFYFLQTLAV